MTEQETIDYLNKTYPSLDLQATSKLDYYGKYCSFDAWGDNHIVEIKNRRKYYKDKMIECYKLFVNYQAAQLSDSRFIYVVTDEKGIWVYPITEKMEEIMKQKPVKIPCPSKTDFEGGKTIDKYCYILNEDMAIKI